jgi:hypothetical protein
MGFFNYRFTSRAMPLVQVGWPSVLKKKSRMAQLRDRELVTSVEVWKLFNLFFSVSDSESLFKNH